MPYPEGGQDAQVHPSHRRALRWSARTVWGHRPRRYARQDAQPGRHPPPAGIPHARSARASRRPGVEPAALRKQRLELLSGRGPTHLQPFYPPLFTRVRGRRILGNSDAASCIVLAHRAGGNGLPPVRGILIETTCWGVELRCAFSVRGRVPGCGRVNSPTIRGSGAVGSPRSAGPHSVGYVGPSEALR